MGNKWSFTKTAGIPIAKLDFLVDTIATISFYSALSHRKKSLVTVQSWFDLTKFDSGLRMPDLVYQDFPDWPFELNAADLHTVTDSNNY